jgi:hypothetical protein
VISARSATTGPHCWESRLINVAELGTKAYEELLSRVAGAGVDPGAGPAPGSGSLSEAGSLLRHPFLAVSTGGTTTIPKSAVHNQLSYAACTLNYLAAGGCTVATSAPGTRRLHIPRRADEKGCPENRNLLRGRRVNMYVNSRSVSTTFAAAGAGGRTDGPLTKPASNIPGGGR